MSPKTANAAAQTPSTVELLMPRIRFTERIEFERYPNDPLTSSIQFVVDWLSAWECARECRFETIESLNAGMTRNAGLVAVALMALLSRSRWPEEPSQWLWYYHRFEIGGKLSEALLERAECFRKEDVEDLIESWLHLDPKDGFTMPAESLVVTIVRLLAGQAADERTSQALLSFRERMARDVSPANRRLVRRLDELLALKSSFPLERGDPWADAAIADLEKLPKEKHPRWVELLNQAAAANGSKATQKWLKRADELSRAVGRDSFRKLVPSWLRLVGRPRKNPADREILGRDPTLMAEQNENGVKGLVWFCIPFDDPKVSAALGELGTKMFQKVPWHGPRSVKVGNACVWALSQMASGPKGKPSKRN